MYGRGYTVFNSKICFVFFPQLMEKAKLCYYSTLAVISQQEES